MFKMWLNCLCGHVDLTAPDPLILSPAFFALARFLMHTPRVDGGNHVVVALGGCSWGEALWFVL
jgi:hypothetical protein